MHDQAQRRRFGGGVRAVVEEAAVDAVVVTRSQVWSVKLRRGRFPAPASSWSTRCSASATLALCARRATYSSMADSATVCIDRPSAAGRC